MKGRVRRKRSAWMMESRNWSTKQGDLDFHLKYFSRIFSEYSGIFWNTLEYSGIFWNTLE